LAVLNLSGAGTTALSSGVTRLFVDVTTFGIGQSKGRASPVNYYDIGLLRLGVQGAYYPAVPIDAASMVLDVPFDTTTLGYSLFAGASLRVTESFLVPAHALQPWDRNPLPVVTSYAAGINGGVGPSQAWSYTVPSGRLFLIAAANCEIGRFALPTTVNYGHAYIQINGITAVQVFYSGNTQGSFTRDSLDGGPMVLRAGDLVAGFFQNTDVGGQYFFTLDLAGTEFDA
jgi:hypothetical protein